ncbi:MAG: 4Fe-4S dicluster domain-containing protein [Desulfosarcina sp.]|nr:4Fe-4S dicluster domain-containing protein [Desulfobacterales bacterium]
MMKQLPGLSGASVFQYTLLPQSPPPPQAIANTAKATLLIDQTFEKKSQMALTEGDAVQTGQKLVPFKDSGAYVISSVTGKVSAIYPYPGDFGKNFTALDIEVAADEMAAPVEDLEPTLDALRTYFIEAPGKPPLDLLGDPDRPIHTIVVSGVDTDLLVASNQYVIRSQIHAITRGIEVLKAAAGVEKIVIAVPRDLISGFGHTGADDLKAISPDYPSAQPRLILYQAFGIEVPADKSCADMGYAFFSAESVAAIGKAYQSGQVPVEKIITLIDKSGRPKIVTARLGTPVDTILQAAGISTADRDRLILGGPMTGTALYDEKQVVRADTDAVMVQDAADVTLVSDYSCINCGECVRACPVRIQVNMLVRFLEAGQYEDGAELYDLYSCVDCGLCSYVCVARIPIYQYIRLAKYELARANAVAEAPDEQ